MPIENTGGKYKSLRLTIPDGTTLYNVAQENSTSFPDWSEDWQDREWYDVLVIKRLSPEDAAIEIKFHRDEFDWIPIEYCDTPTIIDNFVFRDVFIKNDSGEDATFDLLFFSPRVISGEPRRPTNVQAAEVTASSVTLEWEDNTTDDHGFYVERSSTSATEGYSTVGIVKFSNFNQMIGKRREWTDDTVASGISYWYRVYAARRDGLQSNYSNVLSVTTP